MKPYYFFSLLLFSLPAAAQTLTNTGTSLVVGSGTTLYVQGSVQNQAGGTLTNAGTLQLTGDLHNAGTLASPGTLHFAGSSNQTFTPGGATIATLLQQNTGAVGSNVLHIPADVTVDANLTLAQGLIRTAPTATLTLADGAVLQGEATGRYVQGNLRVVDAAGTGLQDFGHGLTLDRTGLGLVTVTRTAGLQTANLSYGQNPSNETQQGIDRIWQVTTSLAPTAPLAITLTWLPDDDHALTDFSNLQAWRSAPGSTAWQPVGASGSGSTSGPERSFSFSAPATSPELTRFTVSSGLKPLPISLISFVAKRQGNTAELLWETSQEVNSSWFEVQSSVDGQHFTAVGQVAGSGTSQQAHQYRLLDANLTRYGATLLYYRLRQVDQDGESNFSAVRTLAVPAPDRLAVYPNPFVGSEVPQLVLQLAEAGQVEITLRDAVGRVLQRQQRLLPAGSTQLPLEHTAALAPGLYTLAVATPQGAKSVKLVKK